MTVFVALFPELPWADFFAQNNFWHDLALNGIQMKSSLGGQSECDNAASDSQQTPAVFDLSPSAFSDSSATIINEKILS